MHPLGFLAFLILSALTLMGLAKPSLAALPVIFVFVGIPLLDIFIGRKTAAYSSEAESSWKRTMVWGAPLYLYFVFHFLILGAGLYFSLQADSWTGVLLIAFLVGLHNGGLGITAAHELCHKKEWHARWAADLILISVWYQHFVVEHVRGHHFQVATLADPASARRDENIYKFFVRCILGSFMDAWKIDSKAVLRGVLLSLAMTIGFAMFGAKALGFFIVQAAVAVLLLESVNYIEHYGLSRKQLENGRFEKVLPIHSWNSDFVFSNYMLFNLQRHSDHHAMAHLPYTVLKDPPTAPLLPAGYPTMILLALVPPMWFRVMNPRLVNLGFE